ncbi:MAG: TIGR02265 family protein [Myxococcales bacterium]
MARPRPETPGIRGSVLLSRIKYIRERGGDDALKRVLAKVPESDRGVLGGWLLNTTWYPLDLNLRLDDAIAQVFSPDDPDRVFLEMGRTSAEVNLAGPHKHFVRKDDPHFLLSQAPVIYAAYYAIGRREYEKTGPSACVLRTFDAESVTLTDCLTVVGWHVRAIELCGGKAATVVEKVCRAKGGERCEYHCSWR